MNPNGFLAEMQVLREMIRSNHQYSPWTGVTLMSSDRKAISKLHMYMKEVFGSDRDARVKVLSILVGRKLDSSVGRRGLTLGELYALLSWCEWDEKNFPIPNPDAEAILIKLRDNPQRWVPIVDSLPKPKVPVGVRYEDVQAEAAPF